MTNDSLFGACEVGDVALVRQHVARGDHDLDGNARLGHIDPRGWRRSPLHVAIQFGHLKLARWLLENGADPNARTKYGDTALNAVLAPPVPPHYVDAVRLLMAHGADPTSPNEDDESPLTNAQRTQAIWNTVGALLTSGANGCAPVHSPSRFTIVHVADAAGDAYYLTVTAPEQIPERALAGDTVVGVVSELPESLAAINPETFAPNEDFLQLLHEVISRRGPEQTGLQREAQRLGKGHVFVIDQRTPSPQGPVPPEDILGYFAVADGCVVPGSYRANPNYRLMTECGLFQLHPELHAALVAELISRS